MNHGDVDLLVHAYGTPPESAHGEILDSAVLPRADAKCREVAVNEAGQALM